MPTHPPPTPQQVAPPTGHPLSPARQEQHRPSICQSNYLAPSEARAPLTPAPTVRTPSPRPALQGAPPRPAPQEPDLRDPPGAALQPCGEGESAGSGRIPAGGVSLVGAGHQDPPPSRAGGRPAARVGNSRAQSSGHSPRPPPQPPGTQAPRPRRGFRVAPRGPRVLPATPRSRAQSVVARCWPVRPPRGFKCAAGPAPPRPRPCGGGQGQGARPEAGCGGQVPGTPRGRADAPGAPLWQAGRLRAPLLRKGPRTVEGGCPLRRTPALPTAPPEPRRGVPEASLPGWEACPAASCPDASRAPWGQLPPLLLGLVWAEPGCPQTLPQAFLREMARPRPISPAPPPGSWEVPCWPRST